MRGSALVAVVAAVLLGVAGPGCQEGDTITAPALSATCEARPSTGPAPLTVSFLLSVAGAAGPFTVAVSYGDGTNGTSADAPHTYASGAFTASFTVSTATQSARCSTAVTALPGTVPSPPPGSNQAPIPLFKSTPDAVGSTISGTAPLTVRFNMCGSTDPESDKIYYLMDFDGDGTFDLGGLTGAHCRADHVYGAGTTKARNCLHDIDAKGDALHNDQCKTYTVVVTP